MSELDRELADVTRRARQELRADRQEAERDAVMARWSRRTIGDVAVEALRRGDLVAISTGTERFTGAITAAGVDYATVADTHRGEVDVHLAAAVRPSPTDADYQGPAVLLEVLRRATSGGGDPAGAGPTFRARLSHWVVQQQLQPRRHVAVTTSLREVPLVGHLRVRAADHVYLVAPDGNEAFVPLAIIEAVHWSAGAER